MENLKTYLASYICINTYNGYSTDFSNETTGWVLVDAYNEDHARINVQCYLDRLASESAHMQYTGIDIRPHLDSSGVA